MTFTRAQVLDTVALTMVVAAATASARAVSRTVVQQYDIMTKSKGPSG